jgi:hypothetical protein
MQNKKDPAAGAMNIGRLQKPCVPSALPLSRCNATRHRWHLGANYFQVFLIMSAIAFFRNMGGETT